MSAISAQKLIGPLAFLDVTSACLKSRYIKDWCSQSWSMVVQFGTPQVYFSRGTGEDTEKGTGS